MSKVFCWECGKKINSSDKICSFCGAEQSLESFDLKENYIKKDENIKESNNNSKFNRHFILNFFKWFLIVAFLMNSLFYFLGVDSTAKNNFLIGLIYILMALVLLPYTDKLLLKINRPLSVKLKTIIVISLFIIASILM